ncbi:hypothetical protein NP233_g5589 [Leucocoprinus birnbaumii]|uniref:Carboxylic ester hydrolase n=1 Tax=Leucocoprinus birnbaumii TaxID=56174 RepID=A0AAD5YWB5_9AGAR|nr:hypothetical protein NP233_g5589 [Leucocoprinus birnbaumii]
MQIPVLLGASLAIRVAHAATQATTVDLGYATYEGSVNNATGNIDFLGIRYAAAPTGTFRWKEPQPPKSTPGVQPANTLPNQCLQGAIGLQPSSPLNPRSHTRRQSADLLPQSEDCLFLKGGYFGGGASVYNGNDLISQAGDGVVVVIIQYRLGIFGFLSSQKVHDGGDLNAGLLDQQFALQWVQKYIDKFGGDPTRVTIWGESAGAGSVIQHIVANDGNTQPPLFHAAMTSSTYLPPQYAFNDRIPEQLFAEVADQSGCSAASDTLDCLRQADVDLLTEVNLNVTVSQFYGTCTFVPVIDGQFITGRPTELLRQGKINGEGLLAVTNSFEGSIFVNSSTADTVTVEDYVPNLFPELTQEHIDAVSAQYADLGAPIDQVRAIMGEAILICPTYLLLRAFDKGFKGEFAIPPALHGNDVLYYFPTAIGDVSPPWNNTEFRNNFSQSFMNFVLAMDPNVKWDPSNSLPEWPTWTEGKRAEMLFNRTVSDVPVFRRVETDEDLLRRCDFWERMSAFTSQ